MKLPALRPKFLLVTAALLLAVVGGLVLRGRLTPAPVTTPGKLAAATPRPASSNKMQTMRERVQAARRAAGGRQTDNAAAKPAEPQIAALPPEVREKLKHEIAEKLGREAGDERRGRYDRPGEAAKYERLRRLPAGASDVPVDRLLQARERMRGMRRYSTRLESFVGPQVEGAPTNEAANEAALGAWAALGPGNVGGRTRAIVINPQNPNVLYAGTGEGFFNYDSLRGAGIFKTADGGATWSAPDQFLSLGANTFTVTAQDASGNTASAKLTVLYKPSQLVSRISFLAIGRRVAVDAAGNVIIADTENHRVLRVEMSNGTTSVNAATYAARTVARGALLTSFGTDLSAVTQAATSLPLPTDIGGTAIRVVPYRGGEVRAPLLFVSPTQINYLMPDLRGLVTMTTVNAQGGAKTEAVWVADVAPGVFTANQTGEGVPAANVVRGRGGVNTYEEMAQYDAVQKTFVPRPIDLGPAGDVIVLELYGTGWRNLSGLSGVKVTIGGVDAEVLYAGQQFSLAGLDQLNVRVPRELAGRGEVDVVVTVDGKQAKPVKIHVR